MGQSSSSNDNTLPVAVETIQDDFLRHARLLSEISILTYEGFQSRLFELNKLSRKCVDSEGNQLVFAVKRGSDKTLIWKGTVKIACVRMNFLTQKVISFRLLTLAEFLRVFKTLESQFVAAEQSRTVTDVSPSANPDYSLLDSVAGLPTSPYTQVTASMLLEELDLAATATQTSERLSECCICLERKPEVLLPCAHSYCLPCIEQWNVNHKTCPICREALDSTDDTWVISEAPGAQEICGSLMELSKAMPHCN